MTLENLFFLAIAIITLSGAVMAVWMKNVFHNALALILSLFGVACLFIYLNAEFLAVMEVIIYIGAIAVAIIFAIMLSRSLSGQMSPREPKKILRSLLVAALLFIGLLRTIRATHWPQTETNGDYSLKALGKSLLTIYALPFEAVSLVLLIAIIGALLISKPGSAKS